MSANLEWTVPFIIRSTYGDLDLNVDGAAYGDGVYLVLPEGSSARRELRLTLDDIPQGDGRIPHRRFASGYEIELLVSLWATRTQPACDEQARLMAEALMLHVNRMVWDTGRILWTPSGLGDDRMLDEALTLESSAFSLGPAGDSRITLRFDSPFPYVLDATQQSVSLPDGVPVVVTNEGNVEVYPVTRVTGAASFFDYENTTTGEQIAYSSLLPGAMAIPGGEYGELDHFRNTAYLNGDEDDLLPGVGIADSDFFALVPGDNTVEITGASATLLFNHGYA